jgi:hypothetical protein
MANPVHRFLTDVSYGLTQLPRLAWYLGHGMLMREFAKEARRTTSAEERPVNNRSSPGRWRLYADMAALFERDLANVEAGIYPLPDDRETAHFRSCSSARGYFLRTCHAFISAESAGTRTRL